MSEQDSKTPKPAAAGKKKARKKAAKKTAAKKTAATGSERASTASEPVERPEQKPAATAAQQNTPPPPVTRSRDFSGRLALLLVLVLAIGLVWFFWQRGWWSLDPQSQQQLHSANSQQLEQLNAQVDALQNRVQQLGAQDPQATVEPLIDSARQQIQATLEDDLQAIDARIDGLQQSTDSQRDAIRAVQNRLADVSTEQQQTQSEHNREQGLLEIRLLLRYARQQLLLNGNADAAVAAYQDAEQVLGGLDIVGADALQAALINERQLIQAVPVTDINAVISELRGLQQAAALWPLRGQPDNSGANEDAGQQNWRDKLRSSFGQLVQVRRSDETIVGVEEAALMRQQLGLQLQTAALLALQGRQDEFRTTIADARRLLQRAYVTDNRGVAAALDTLESMGGTQLTPDWPELGEAAAQLEQLSRGAAG